MMNKLLTKTTKKLTLLCLVMVVIVALATVCTAIFGVNTAMRMNDQTTVTVKMSAVYYRDETKREAVEAVCEDVFKDLGVEYVYESQMSGDDCELMYVFKKDADVSVAKAALKTAFSAEAYDGAFIMVESGKEAVQAAIAPATIIRAAVAVAAFAILAFAYTWIRYDLVYAVTTASAVALTALLSAALILLARIPVTASVLYVCAVAPLLAAVFAILGVNKLAANQSSDSVEAKVVKSVAVKETLATVAGLGGALVLVGAIGTWAMRWFAICSLIGLLVSAAVAIFVIPALQLPLLEKQAKLAAERNKSGYVGAKKETEETQE